MDRPSLVVLPTSLIFNWKREAEQFAPQLRLLSLHGKERAEHFPAIPLHDVILTTYPLLWRGGVADRAIVKRDGQLVTELALNAARKYEVTGAIGTTVIEVQPGRARVLSDPGPRQYCVQQGWLTRANAVAICAPNHVTLQLAGRSGRNGSYDTLNY